MTDTIIAELGLKQLYYNYSAIAMNEPENKELQKNYYDIRYGEQGVELDIHDIIEEDEGIRKDTYIIIDRKKQLAILGAVTIPLNDYRTEKERRMGIMRIELEKRADNDMFTGQTYEDED